MQDKKHHHYVPIAYLRFFCNERGKVCVYLKDDPEKLIQQSPDNVGFHKYYYSQPLPEGGNDNNTLENMFSLIETKWPLIVEKIIRKENVNGQLEDIYNFIALQSVRVPANRDALEKIRAHIVKTGLENLDTTGELPPKPEGFTLDHVVVSIDPHTSLHDMVSILEKIGGVMDLIGIGALKNTTNIPFLTSDNPIIWFDPSIPESKMKPYLLRIGGPVTFIFPITPDLIIYGSSSMRENYRKIGFGFAEVKELNFVKKINRQICRFAYKAIFSQKPGQEALIRNHSTFSPISDPTIFLNGSKNGIISFPLNTFGKRERKPKWQRN